MQYSDKTTTEIAGFYTRTDRQIFPHCKKVHNKTEAQDKKPRKKRKKREKADQKKS